MIRLSFNRENFFPTQTTRTLNNSDIYGHSATIKSTFTTGADEVVIHIGRGHYKTWLTAETEGGSMNFRNALLMAAIKKV